MTAIVPPQSLTSRKTAIEDRDWYLQTTNLSVKKRPIIKTIQDFIFIFILKK